MKEREINSQIERNKTIFFANALKSKTDAKISVKYTWKRRAKKEEEDDDGKSTHNLKSVHFAFLMLSLAHQMPMTSIWLNRCCSAIYMRFIDVFSFLLLFGWLNEWQTRTICNENGLVVRSLSHARTFQSRSICFQSFRWFHYFIAVVGIAAVANVFLWFVRFFESKKPLRQEKSSHFLHTQCVTTKCLAIDHFWCCLSLYFLCVAHSRNTVGKMDF